MMNTHEHQLPTLPAPDGTVEIDHGPAPGGGREVTFGDAWSEPLVREYARAAIASSAASQGEPDGWISVHDRMPEPGTECLVWIVRNPFAKEPYVFIDTWDVLREDPIGMGGPTIETGLGWGDNEFEDISHWMPLPGAPSASERQQGGRCAGCDIPNGCPEYCRCAPDEWAIERGNGWVSIRNKTSQCGQDFYPDRDPLIYAFLQAIRPAPAATRAGDLSAEKLAKASAWDRLRASCVLRDVTITIGDTMDTMDALLAERLAAQPPQAPPAAPSLAWADAPRKIEFGAGMAEALLALGRDDTLHLYASKSAIGLVVPALSAFLAVWPATPSVDQWEALARRFHETYERLAPKFGYETRFDTKTFDPATPNGRLMIAVLTELGGQPAAPVGRKSLSASVADALRPFLSAGQKVIWREPFRWFDDNGVLSNHYDGMSVTYLAQEFGYEVIHDCECAAVIASPKTGGDNG